MCCTKRAKDAYRKFKNLLLRTDLKQSEIHRSRWKEFDKWLIARNMISIYGYVFYDLLSLIYESNYQSIAREYLDDGGPP